MKDRKASRWLANGWLIGGLLAWPGSALAGEGGQHFDLGIESMRSHSYSVGIFIFMMIAMAVFVGIIVGYMRTHKSADLKPGEKVMFIAIVLGVVVAAIFAALQLLDGFLF